MQTRTHIGQPPKGGSATYYLGGENKIKKRKGKERRGKVRDVLKINETVDMKR